MRRVILVHFVGLVAMWLSLDMAVSLYRHDWYTSGYWLAEIGKAITLGVWMAAIGAYAEHRKRIKTGKPDSDRSNSIFTSTSRRPRILEIKSRRCSL